MKATRLLASLAILASLAGVANAQTGCVRLSWNTCDPWIRSNCFAGPGKYRLVLSATGIGTPNVATDCNIRIQPINPGSVPDAWRFDDQGCQTGSRLGLSTDALDSSCPALKGPEVQEITGYFVNPVNGTADLRLVVFYNSVAPNPATRYTLWTILFDHSHSTDGPSPPDHSLCGDVDECLFFTLSQAILLPDLEHPVNFAGCDVPWPGFSPAATWGFCPPFGSGNCVPVPTTSQTWGRVRATYR